MSNENNPTGASTQENLESSKTHARQAAEDLRAAAQAKVDEIKDRAGAYYGEARHRAEEAYGEARHRAEEAYGQARNRANSLQEDGEAYIRQNPLRAVAMAVGAGFFLGLIFRR